MRPRRFQFILLLGLLLGIALLFMVYAAASGRRFQMLPDQTVYAGGYTAKKWAQIRVGMPEKEVLDILGAPLEITEVSQGRILRIIGSRFNECYPDLPPSQYGAHKIDYRWFSYSSSGKLWENYYVRAIKIGNDNHVLGVESVYHYD